MEQKLKKEGKPADSWKDWFIKPENLEYAKIRAEMRMVVDKNGALNNSQHGIWNIQEDYHMNAFIAEQSISQIDKYLNNKQPFFIWASFFDPHPPYLGH
jgi:uncharacterized sulfatase